MSVAEYVKVASVDQIPAGSSLLVEVDMVRVALFNLAGTIVEMHDLIAMLLIVAALFTQTLQPGRCFIGQKRRDGRQQLNMAREPGGLLAVEQFGMNTISGLSIQSFFQFQQAGQRAGVRVVAWMFGQAQQAALDFGKNLSAFGSKSFEIIRTDPCFRPTAEVAINGQIAKGP